MNNDPVDALVQDVHDLLDTSSVGLYEFLWILRGMDIESTDDTLSDLAVKALRRLLVDSQHRLVQLKWPSEDLVGTVAPDYEVRPTDWDDPRDQEPYIAIAYGRTE